MENFIGTLKGWFTSIGIAAVGMFGVSQGDSVAQVVQNAAGITEKAAQSPNWVEPLLQAIIAVVTILAQFFANRPKRKE